MSPAARTATRTWRRAERLAGAGRREQREALQGAAPARPQAPGTGRGIEALAGRPRTSRGASASPSRSASSGSALWARAAGSAAREASSASVSISEKRPGCSEWAERSSPHSEAAPSSGVSPRPVAAAPSVSTARRLEARGSEASQRLASASASSLARRAAVGGSPPSSPAAAKSTASRSGLPGGDRRLELLDVRVVGQALELALPQGGEGGRGALWGWRLQCPPGEPQQRLGAGPGRPQLLGGDGAGAQGADPGHRAGALVIGAQLELLPLCGEDHPQGPGAGGAE